MSSEIGKQRILIQKFGGSSLASLADIDNAISAISSARGNGDHVVVVVSARGKTTDNQIALIDQFTSMPDLREVDQMLATGETASAAMMALRLNEKGISARSLTAYQAGIYADGPHGSANITSIERGRIDRVLKRDSVPVVAGFQGVDNEGDIVTLGRGGSDSTAVALAIAFGQDLCHIYTDVDGVYSADPRIVENARRIPEIDSRVMVEMSDTGAKVLHGPAASLAHANGLTVKVSSTFAQNSRGTVISPGAMPADDALGQPIAVCDDQGIGLLRLKWHSGLGPAMWEVISALSSRQVRYELMSCTQAASGEVDALVAVPADEVPQVQVIAGSVDGIAADLTVLSENAAKVSVVGNGRLDGPGHLPRTLRRLARSGVRVIGVSHSLLRISVIVPRNQARACVAGLHREFGLERGAADGTAGRRP